MKRNKFFAIGIFIVTAISCINTSFASHIRAGELTVERRSSDNNIYRITLTIYRDTDGVDFRFGTLDFGDNKSIENFTSEENPYLSSVEVVGDKIEKYTFQADHEYIAKSGDFTVSFKEEFRNNGIENIEGSNSGNTPFYIESKFKISPSTGANSSPLLTIPPVDEGAVGALYIHNPGAFDPDGDSLTFELITPFQGSGESIGDYDLPNSSNFYADFGKGNSMRDGFPTFTLDKSSGNLVWDAPGKPGEYNLAFKVIEWRKLNGVYTEIGHVVRDMQITIAPLDNNPPEIDPIGPICVDAGEVGRNIITARDPDGDLITFEAFGEPFEVTSSPATFLQRSGIRSLLFEWETNCTHAREATYEVVVKAKDDGSPSLVDVETFDVTVASPAPEGLRATLMGPLSSEIEWDSYDACQVIHTMQIWRRDDSFDFTPDPCETGIPQNGDYELVGQVSGGDPRAFNDTALSAGKKFCYRVVANYTSKNGQGLSYTSEEVCVETQLVQPLILNVDVLKNEEGTDQGDLFIKWQSPKDLDSTIFKRPFTYQLSYDAPGGPVALFPAPIADTTFVIKNADLNDTGRLYFVDAYSPTGDTLYQRSERASVVKLEISQVGSDAKLDFSANVPWNILDDQVHYIYRNNIDPTDSAKLVLIDSTTTLTYVDRRPQQKKVEYYYYVATNGAYSDPEVERPLVNRSANKFIFISDSVNFCKPVLGSLPGCKESLSSLPCEIAPNQYSTTLNWTEPEIEDACLGVLAYVVLFSPNCDDNYDTLPIGNDPTALSYVHRGLESLNGCYKVASVNFLGVTVFSEIQEKDGTGCQQLKLPNLFTPNGDGYNDFYTSFNDVEHKILTEGLQPPNIDFADCPRFVKSLQFRIYDRTGNQVFDYSSAVGDPFLSQKELLIGWDGKNKAGREMPTGRYYYGTDIIFYNFGRSEDLKEQRKGWIELRR